MPLPDFQAALAVVNSHLQDRARLDPAFNDALSASLDLISRRGTRLTVNVHGALGGLAAVLAIELQDYAYDALSQLVQGTPLQTWALLPQEARDMLDDVWPSEGGMTFLGKIGVALVSEGFCFP